MSFIGAAIGAAVGVWTVLAAIGVYIMRKRKRDVAEVKEKLEEMIAMARRGGRGSNQELN